MFDTRMMAELRTEDRPDTPVLIHIDGRWWPGILDKWCLEHDGWYGRATLTRTGATNWWPAVALRRREEARPQ